MNKSCFSLLIALTVVGCASGSENKGIDAPVNGDGSDDDAGAPADGSPDDDQEEDAGPPPEEQEGVCGDFTCNVNETCALCPIDCGDCPVCDLAPSCTGAVALPTVAPMIDGFSYHKPRDSAGESLYVSGVNLETGEPLGTSWDDTDCVAPQLRLRIRQIKVDLDGISNGSANVYCVIDASDGAHSEVMITPIQKDIGDDAPALVFSPESSTFWGQGKPWQSLNNLTITYKCFHSPNPSATKAVFDAIQEGAVDAGGIAGPWGWAFGVGSVGAGIVAAAIPQAQDQLRLSVQQTIDKSMLLELTNGRRWTLRTEGDSDGWLIGGYWDWTVEIEAWGCSDAKITAD